MKGMGALQAMTLSLLRRLPVPLERDVVLLAVADEEVGNMESRPRSSAGTKSAVARRERRLDGVDGILFEGQVVFPISVGEKATRGARS